MTTQYADNDDNDTDMPESELEPVDSSYTHTGGKTQPTRTSNVKRNKLQTIEQMNTYNKRLRRPVFTEAEHAMLMKLSLEDLRARSNVLKNEVKKTEVADKDEKVVAALSEQSELHRAMSHSNAQLTKAIILQHPEWVGEWLRLEAIRNLGQQVSNGDMKAIEYVLKNPDSFKTQTTAAEFNLLEELSKLSKPILLNALASVLTRQDIMSILELSGPES